MGAVELSGDDLVADGGPADFSSQLNPYTFAAKEALFLRNNQGRSVVQGDEPEPERNRRSGLDDFARESSGPHVPLLIAVAVPSGTVAR